MSRVEWTRYSGEDIEAVVAMFISAEYPTAERITPSVGDGGIDVLVKTDKVRVYQVKKFTAPLTSSQQNQVKKSVDRLVADERVKDLRVDEWHLVMPWDPTLEAKKWLTDYVIAKGLPEPIWDGLTRCDLWASKFPYIVDYYLRGNAERIREMALFIVQGMRLKNIRGEDPKSRDISEFSDELKETVATLNREDPFYAYGIHVEPQGRKPDRDDIHEALRNVKPGIVYSTLMGDGTVSVQVDVYAKNRVANELAPLKIDVVATLAPGSEHATALQEFIKFGSPLELPNGSASGKSTLPGGLSGKFENASIALYPISEFREGENELRLVIFDEEGQQIDSLIFYRRYTTTGFPTDQGPRGVESLLTDSRGIVKMIMRIDVDEQTVTRTTKINPLNGLLAVDVLGPLRFYNRMKDPNTMVVAPRFGPIPSVRESLPEKESNGPELLYNIAKALCLIQEHTSHRLSFPNLQEIEEPLIHEILRTGALLEGQTLTLKAGYARVEHDPRYSDEAETIVLLTPWKIILPEGGVDLGYFANAFSGSFHEQAVQGPDGLYDVWSINDGKVLVRMLTDEEKQALPNL